MLSTGVFHPWNGGKIIFRKRNDGWAFLLAVQESLDKQLGRFLRKKRGDMTFAAFSRKTGVPGSTLFRLENGEQSVTLRRLEQVLKRLKCSLKDVFPAG